MGSNLVQFLSHGVSLFAVCWILIQIWLTLRKNTKKYNTKRRDLMASQTFTHPTENSLQEMSLNYIKI